MSSYKITTYEVGDMQNLVYLVKGNNSSDVILFDIGWDADKIIKIIQENNLNLKAVALTHSHYDHTNALPDLLEKYPVPVYISPPELDFWHECNITDKKLIKTIKDNDEIKIGTNKIKVILTPGHSPGSVCYLLEQHLITGDTLFLNSAGRTDLSGGNAKELYQSLNKLKKIVNDDIIIMSGHLYGDVNQNTFGEQRITNPFLKIDNKDDFEKFCNRI